MIGDDLLWDIERELDNDGERERPIRRRIYRRRGRRTRYFSRAMFRPAQIDATASADASDA